MKLIVTSSLLGPNIFLSNTLPYDEGSSFTAIRNNR